MNELTFKKQKITPIVISGQSYLRVPQIAVALQYKKADRVNELYARHADEFTPEMTFLTEVDTAGGKQQVRVFSLRGCHLLAMFAKTPVAKEFRRWALDVLEQQSLPAPVPALDAKAIGGIVKKCAAKAVKDELAECRAAPFKVATAYERQAFVDEIKNAVKDALWETINPCILQGGLKKTPLHNGYVTADGLPPANWILGIIHGANALECCINRLVERQKDAVNLLEPKQ